MTMTRKDADLIQTKALPTGAAATSIDGFDLQISGKATFDAPVELLINAPALGTTPLPDAKTMTYSVEHDDAANFGTAVEIADQVLVQTGAGGAGDDAAEARFRLPSNVKRYVRVKATGSGAGDASGSEFTVSMVF